MKYIKNTLLVVVLGAVSVHANAGLWDTITSFFGGSEQNTAEAAEQAAPAAAPNLVKTGLQLLPLITQTLGVTGDQAQGGMGALLQAAQGLMSGGDFGALSSAIPGASSLLAAAPKLDGDSGGLMGGVMQAAGAQSETAKAGLQLVSQFKSLGMGADMIPKFTEVADGYLKQSSTPETGDMLTSALSGLF